MSGVESIGNVYDEPFADPTIPNLLSKFARTKQRSILSGDGADEFLVTQDISNLISYGVISVIIIRKREELSLKHWAVVN